MSLTRAAVEGELIVRLGPILTRVGLPTTQTGSNAGLNGPIRRAARSVGLSVADAINVTDADLAPATGWTVEKLLDEAELRTLENIWGNWAEVRERISDGEVDAEQLADRIQARIAFLSNRIREPYGMNINAPATGRVQHGQRIPRDEHVRWPYPFGFRNGGSDPLW